MNNKTEEAERCREVAELKALAENLNGLARLILERVGRLQDGAKSTDNT